MAGLGGTNARRDKVLIQVNSPGGTDAHHRSTNKEENHAQ
jgi:hypothetical protein